MLRFLIICVFPALVFADVYYAKNEPIKIYEYSAEVSGAVVSVDTFMQGRTNSEGKVVVRIDDALDREYLTLSKEALGQIKERIESLKEIVRIDSENYERVKDLKTKSKVQKELELKTMLNSKMQLNSAIEQEIATKKEIERLKESIRNKNIAPENLYIGEVYVEEGEYVTNGKRILDAYDTSKAKLILYITKEDVENLAKGSIFIDGEKFEGKVDFVQKVADVNNISSYKVQITKKAPEIFSSLSKVEIKK